MSKVIMWNLMSLDGYFNGIEDWQLDFHNYAYGDELEQFSLEQLESAGGLIFGRVTFEGMAKYWVNDTTEIGNKMRIIPKYVFSRTLKSLKDNEWENSYLLKNDLVKEIDELKEKSNKDIFIFGSAKLSDEMISYDLIDEFRICVVPVILGNGQRLFKPKKSELKLELVKSKQLKTGGLLLYYKPIR